MWEHFERRYLQFNNLVFDGYDMLSDYDTDISFKGSSQEISYGHGAYRPLKANYLFVNEQTVSMTLTLRMKKIPCEYRPYYIQFAKEELTKPGKLWAIENNEILWANAVVTSMSPEYAHQRNKVVFVVNFAIPGGVWHKADKQKTFLVPWDICTFMECKGYQTLQPCKGYGDNCCPCVTLPPVDEDCSCCCDELTQDMQLCYHLDELEHFYDCDIPWQLVYDCIHAEKFSKEKFLGQKICVKDICDDNVIAGRFYSETDIPTQDITIVIDGHMYNPWVTINGNTNIIKGEYDGSLIIKSNGDVYYQKSECCQQELLDPSIWIVPSNNTYGWTVNPGVNSIVVRLNACCGRTCVYIQDNPITM